MRVISIVVNSDGGFYISGTVISGTDNKTVLEITNPPELSAHTTKIEFSQNGNLLETMPLISKENVVTFEIQSDFSFEKLKFRFVFLLDGVIDEFYSRKQSGIISFTDITGVKLVYSGDIYTKKGIESLLTGVIASHSHIVEKADVDLGNCDNTSDVNKPVSTAQATAIGLKQNSLGFIPEAVGVAAGFISSLKDGVSSPGNTLLKLYNLILGGINEVYVANIAARDVYNVPHLPFSIFVLDDGDSKWGQYRATTTGVGATFVKTSDPDLLNAVMSASAVKVSYESNSDTNALTNALKTNYDASYTWYGAAATNIRAVILTGLSTATNALITASDSVLAAFGKLQAQISAITPFPGFGTNHTAAAYGDHSHTASTIVGTTDTQTLTNKRITKRVVAVTQAAAPAMNVTNGDIFEIVGLAQAITSMTTNLTGAAVEGDMIEIIIKDSGVARVIAWGASFLSSTTALPLTTVASTPIAILLQYRTSAVWTTTTAWYCLAVA